MSVGFMFLTATDFYEPVAQLVEHRTFNAVVAGSSPARLTILFNHIQLVSRALRPRLCNFFVFPCLFRINFSSNKFCILTDAALPIIAHDVVSQNPISLVAANVHSASWQQGFPKGFKKASIFFNQNHRSSLGRSSHAFWRYFHFAIVSSKQLSSPKPTRRNGSDSSAITET